MNRKALLSIVLVCTLALVFALPAGARYDNVVGELRDVVTDTTWIHGGWVTVHHCDSGGLVAGPVEVGTSGTFNISLVDVQAPRICIVVDFNQPSGGEDPADAAKAFDNPQQGVSGELDAEVFYALTGPNAVTLQQVTASAGSLSPALLALGTILLGAVSLVAVRRRATL